MKFSDFDYFLFPVMILVSSLCSFLLSPIDIIQQLLYKYPFLKLIFVHFHVVTRLENSLV